MQAFPELIAGTGGMETQAGALVAISARAPLEFWQFAVGYCLDAPDIIPVGCMSASAIGSPFAPITYR